MRTLFFVDMNLLRSVRCNLWCANLLQLRLVSTPLIWSGAKRFLSDHTKLFYRRAESSGLIEILNIPCLACFSLVLQGGNLATLPVLILAVDHLVPSRFSCRLCHPHPLSGLQQLGLCLRRGLEFAVLPAGLRILVRLYFSFVIREDCGTM